MDLQPPPALVQFAQQEQAPPEAPVEPTPIRVEVQGTFRNRQLR